MNANGRPPGSNPMTSARYLRLFPLALVGLGVAGCANPGPPKPPSLRLPAPVTSLSATRSGDDVELRFTAPMRSTDKLPLRAATITGAFCRGLEHRPCVAVGPRASFARLAADGSAAQVVWHDHLPPALVTGAPRLLAYRVELFNDSGRSAGPSEPAYVAAGQAPDAVADLRAEGTRQGVMLRWAASAGEAGEVILRREELAPPNRPARSEAAKPPAQAPDKRGNAMGAHPPAGFEARHREEDGVDWLDTNAAAGDRTLDTTASADVPYRYVAYRQSRVRLGDRTFELRSAPSAPVEIVLRDLYPPTAPSGLAAAPFFADPGSAGGFTVDLVWQPVEDEKLAGYNVYREAIDARGAASGARQKLTAKLAPLPSFHDATAKPGVRYRYSVTAVGTNGAESAAATVVLEATQQ